MSADGISDRYREGATLDASGISYSGGNITAQNSDGDWINISMMMPIFANDTKILSTLLKQGLIEHGRWTGEVCSSPVLFLSTDWLSRFAQAHCFSPNETNIISQMVRWGGVGYLLAKDTNTETLALLRRDPEFGVMFDGEQ